MYLLYNLDFLDGIEKIDDYSIDLIITDPPFGVDIQNNQYFDDSKEYVFSHIESWIYHMWRVLKKNSHCYIYVPSLEIDKWVSTVKKYFNYNNLLGGDNYTTHKYQANNFDFSLQCIIYCSKGKAKDLNYIDWIKTSSSWYRDNRNKNPKEFTHQYPSYIPKKFRANVKPNQQVKLVHPCQKNGELIEKFILLSSEKNDVVMDPFCGSGIVCASAINLNRKFVGYEKDKEYYNKAIELINNHILIKKSKGKRMF